VSEQTQRATLSVAIITFNEEENIGRTLASVKDIADEIIIVDSGSTDRTVEIAKQFGAKVFIEEWKGFAAQKNSALDKCACDWILSLDADEEVSPELGREIPKLFNAYARWKRDGMPTENDFDSTRMRNLDLSPWALDENPRTFALNRRNYFLGCWVKHGGFYPDPKTRLFRKGSAHFALRAVHEDVDVNGASGQLDGDLIHHQYPTLTAYIEHMNRYSSLGAEMVVEKRGRVGFSVINIVLRPLATFIYNYFFRLGFLDGKEGLLLHLYHSVYVSWKYAKAWELSRKK
jgi:glycosyltransferase involved in cell wall biosynthesis